MTRSLIWGALLGATSMAAGVFIASGSHRAGRLPLQERPAPGLSSPVRGSAPDPEDRARWSAAVELERRVESLAERLVAEAGERKRLESRIEELAAQLASSDRERSEPANRTASTPAAPAEAVTAEAGGNAARAAEPAGGVTMETALIAAGVDELAAAEIKRRHDELALSQIYLRDLAAREGWLDSPRFREEMAEIEAQQTSIRDEIGEEGFDRYLAALGQPNRVTVDEVLVESPAAYAGLQPGDVILRYGEDRIFAPRELVAATRGGTSGEPVRLEVLRGRRRVSIEVTRGPLGVRVAASRSDPDDG